MFPVMKPNNQSPFTNFRRERERLRDRWSERKSEKIEEKRRKTRGNGRES